MTDLILELQLRVHYDTNGTDSYELRDNLFQIADKAFREGMITDDSAAEVEEHDIQVVTVPMTRPQPDQAPQTFCKVVLGYVEHSANEATVFVRTSDRQVAHQVAHDLDVDGRAPWGVSSSWSDPTEVTELTIATRDEINAAGEQFYDENGDWIPKPA